MTDSVKPNYLYLTILALTEDPSNLMPDEDGYENSCTKTLDLILDDMATKYNLNTSEQLLYLKKLLRESHADVVVTE